MVQRCFAFVEMSMSRVLSQCFLHSFCQLIGAGSAPAVAVVAFEYAHRFFSALTLQQFADGFQVAVAAAFKADAV